MQRASAVIFGDFLWIFCESFLNVQTDFVQVWVQKYARRV